MSITEPQFGDNFFGRSEDVRKLTEKITNFGIVLLSGPRGVGKTNLMHVVAHDLNNVRTEIIDGNLFEEEINELFVPDKKFSGISLQGAFNGYGGGVGFNWDQRQKGFLEYLEGRSEHLTIFIENAHKVAQTNQKIITQAARRNRKLKFVLEVPSHNLKDIDLEPGSYETLQLEELSKDDVRKIVEQLNGGFDRTVSNKVADVSNGIPYYARSLAQIIREKEETDENYKFLEDLQGITQEHVIRQIHKEILNSLEKIERKVVKSIALAPPFITIKSIQAFCNDLPVEKLDTALNGLQKKGIVIERNEYFHLYHFLFRAYLREIQKVKLNNLEKYYHRAAQQLKDITDSRFLLYETLGNPEIFEKLTSMIMNEKALQSAGFFALKEGKWKEAEAALKEFLKHAHDRDEHENKAIALENIGILLQKQGKYSQSLEYYLDSAEINRELGKNEQIVSNYANIASLHGSRGNYHESIKFSKKALNLAKELALDEALPQIYRTLGINYDEQGEVEQAKRYLEKSIRKSKTTQNTTQLMNSTTALGNLLLKIDNIDKALSYYQEALKVSRDLGDLMSEAQITGHLAEIFREKGNITDALNHIEKAQELNQRLNRKKGLAVNYLTKGNIYDEEGKFNKAENAFKQSLELAKGIGLKAQVGKIHGAMGKHYQLKNELESAINHYECALDYFKSFEAKLGASKTLVNIGDILIKTNDRAAAKEKYLEAKKLSQDTKFSSIVKERLKRLN